MGVGQPEQGRIDSVHVVLAVGAPRGGVVGATTLWFATPPRVVDFGALNSGCVTIRDVAASRQGQAIGLVADTLSPWLSWHDTSEVATESTGPLAYRVTWRVEPSGEWDGKIPLVMPARPLASRNGTPPRVRLSVTGAETAPRFPQFVSFAGAFLAEPTAIPSSVVLGGMATASCDLGQRSSGGRSLSVRFVALITIMALWVPLYFVWARVHRSEA